MTTRERYAITGGIVVVLLLSRFAVIAATVAIGGPWRPDAVLVWITGLGGLLLALPLAIETIDRAADRPFIALLLNVGHGLLFALISLLALIAVSPPEPTLTLSSEVLGVFVLYAGGGMLISAGATGVVRAIHWYRAALAADVRRAQLEADEARRTRELVEHRLRPRTTVALLERIAALVVEDRPRAETLLFRLARHERMLLGRDPERQSLEEDLRALRSALTLEHHAVAMTIHGESTQPAASAARALVAAIERTAIAVQPVSLAIETVAIDDAVRVRLSTGSVAFRERFAFEGASAGEDGTIIVDLPFEPATPAAEAQVEPPRPGTMAVVLMMLAYVAIFISIDHGMVDWEEWRAFAAASLISVALWPIGASLLDRAIRRVVSLRFGTSVTLAGLSIVLVALVVTLASVSILAIATATPVRTLLELGMLVSQVYGRNILLALTIGATSFAIAFIRVLLAAHAAAARLMDDHVQAATRELEARFHPHFLLNALTSIAALVRMDPHATAIACRRLAELVERTAGCAGQQYWTVGQELDLVSDYVAVQRMRFQERLRVAEWDVASVPRQVRFPRLVLQPLVENVFKHGVARSTRPTTVGLSMRKWRRTLELAIWNDSPAATAPERLGRGLSFVTRRVEAVGGAVSIETPAADRFLVRCSIPLPDS